MATDSPHGAGGADGVPGPGGGTPKSIASLLTALSAHLTSQPPPVRLEVVEPTTAAGMGSQGGGHADATPWTATGPWTVAHAPVSVAPGERSLV